MNIAKNPKASIVFFGNERLATGVKTSTPTLKALLKAGYKVSAIVLNNDKSVSRSSRDLEIESVAKNHGITVLFPDKLSLLKDQLEELKADIGILVAYGKIVPANIMGFFPSGIINIHPSLLPLHRGSTPIESVILEGASETGVSLMQLANEMDAGPVYVQKKLKLTGIESKQELADQLLSIGSSLVIDHLPSILDGSLKPKAQDHTKATYDSLISKSDGNIDWKKPADVIARQIRAYEKWPKSFTVINNHQVIIKKASVVEGSKKPGSFEHTNDSLVVFCGDKALSVEIIQPLDRAEMPISAFLAGYSLV